MLRISIGRSVQRRICRLSHCWKSSLSSSSEWTSNRVRSTFIEYFQNQRGHTMIESSPVAPHNDTSLLFTNAGMNQFKSIFLGELDKSSPLQGINRAVNSQKCIRAGGKHNDLDDVGKDSYHHTFFEMLGTWSFGEYFKKEAIDWAYDLLVNVYKLPKEQLYVSYFAGDAQEGLPADEESRLLWSQYFPPDRILPFSKSANFWEMGEVGPCGPCSEIHFDRLGGGGEERNVAHLVNQDDPNVLEVWNLVFMQYNRGADGSLMPLPARHIDTGMGLERLTSVLQKKPSNYDTDLFVPLFDRIHEVVRCSNASVKPYGAMYGAADANNNYRDTAYRIIADHARTATVAITDGVHPSSDGRGYVLRRIIRRALRYGVTNLGAQVGFFSKILPVVATSLGEAFPNLLNAGNMERVQSIVLEEEESFGRVLDRGEKEFAAIIKELRQIEISNHHGSSEKVFPGDKAFYLHDSLGLPVDLTQIMAEEAGYTVDMVSFAEEMLKQKQQSSAPASTSAAKCGSEKVAVNAHLVPPDGLKLDGYDIAALNEAGVPATNDSLKYVWHDGSCDSEASSFHPTVRAIVLPSENKRNKLILANSPLGGGALEELFSDLRGSTSNQDGSAIVGLVFDSTRFYAEAGGQVGDVGEIVLEEAPLGRVARCGVTNVQVCGGFVVHQCVVDLQTSAVLTSALGDSSQSLSPASVNVTMIVDLLHRRKVAPNHTMTHVLNFALTRVLQGSAEHANSAPIDQKGSLVNSTKLRFDYSFNKQPSLTELEAIEALANEAISAGLPIEVHTMRLKDALDLRGVRAMFGETYPDPVRVVSITGGNGNAMTTDNSCHSVELCGGTHIANTAEAGSFVIVEESSVAKGVRRISAVTLEAAREVNRNNVILRHKVDRLRQTLDQAISDSSFFTHVETQMKEIRGVLSADGLQDAASCPKSINETISSYGVGYLDKVRARTACDEVSKQLLSLKEKALLHSVDSIVTRFVSKIGSSEPIDLSQLKSDPDLMFAVENEEKTDSLHGLIILNNVPLEVKNSPKATKHLIDMLSKSVLAGKGRKDGWDGVVIALLDSLPRKDIEVEHTMEYTRINLVSVLAKESVAVKTHGNLSADLWMKLLTGKSTHGASSQKGGKVQQFQSKGAIVLVGGNTDKSTASTDILCVLRGIMEESAKFWRAHPLQ